MKQVFLSICLIIWTSCATGTKPLDAELTRLDTDTALVFPSQEIDEYPVWSPDSKSIAFNAAGTWYKLDLGNAPLSKGVWRNGLPIGIVSSLNRIEEMDADLARVWQKQTNWAPRNISRADGTTIELRDEGMRTSLIITHPGKEAQKVWTSDLENCHSLSLSPDGKYVAYIAELNGGCVMAIE